MNPTTDPDPAGGQTAQSPGVAGSESTKELRLALVCYGGVSLAIYMHGVTKEIHKLVVASRALERDSTTNPFQRHETERVYWTVLKDLHDRTGVQTRVVVDIIAGTSAGGINGVFLAKALAGNLSQNALRDLWMEHGDITKLVAAHKIPTLPLKMLVWGAGAIASGFSGRPPLDGDLMLRLLYRALGEMDRDKHRPIGGSIPTLVPQDQTLELFVTATDFKGYSRYAPAFSPKQVSNSWHRHVLEFRSSGRYGDQFEPSHNAALAFAARATSCFPGAFPSLDIQDVARVLQDEGWPGAFPQEFCRIYEASGADVGTSQFVDGGVLDNFPFKLAIDAIAKKPASMEVDRRLLYIEPDPGGPPPPARKGPRKPPGFLATVWGGLSTIPRAEPTLNDLLDLRRFNERVGQVGDIVQTSFDQVGVSVAQAFASAPADRGAYSEANARLIDECIRQSGFAYAAYLLFKLHGVVERFAQVVSDVCEFPAESNQAFFINDVLKLWARDSGLLKDLPTNEQKQQQVEFLKTFDLGYVERRLRFVIKGINELYDKVDERTTRPLRADLDAAKDALFRLIGEIERAIDDITQAPDPAGPAARIGSDVKALFADTAISDAIDQGETDQDLAVELFLTPARRDEITRIKDQFGEYLNERMKDLGIDLYHAFDSATEGWDVEVKRRLNVRYVGFPFWDVLIHPIQRVSDVGELSRVEVVRMSPNDVTFLEPRGDGASKEKLKGVARAHFGAFFKRSYRENDYLWGRLDGLERLIWLLLESGGQERERADEWMRRYCPEGFQAILEDEQEALTAIGDVFQNVRGQLQSMVAGAGGERGRAAPRGRP